MARLTLATGIMTLADRTFRLVGACLAASMAMLPVQTAQAETVTNVATVQWSVGGEDHSLQSNVVSFNTVLPDIELQTFTPMPGAGTSASLKANYCPALQSFTVATGGDGQFQETPILRGDVIHIGQRLVVRLTAVQANRDPGSIDQLELRLETPRGERETIVADETGVDTGEFFAAIATSGIPPQAIAGDCRLSLASGDNVTISAYSDGGLQPIATGQVNALADPYGIVFDSLTGAPVNGVRVSLLDILTGLPANVFGYDGVTPYPSTVFTGETVTDAAGDVYQLDDGGYLFPLAALGRYQIVVEPPAPYSAPSRAPLQYLASLTAPDGRPYVIAPASFGEAFDLSSVDPLRVDVPIDAPGGSLTMEKQVSRDRAQPGDALFFSIVLRNSDSARPSQRIHFSDAATEALRLKPGSVRVDGKAPDEGITILSEDGHGFNLELSSISGSSEVKISYVMTVRPDAAPGVATNRAVASTDDGPQTLAEANVRIERDQLADRMTLIGRVMADGCGVLEQARGISGVRVMLEDGSFAITDADGRYHFEGLVPGMHVAQAAKETLPEGAHFVDCERSTRSTGSANSRFVSGQGGSLVRANFHAIVPGSYFEQSEQQVAKDAEANEVPGAIDWIALGDGPAGFIFPALDHNPRSPAIRVAVRHEIGQLVSLTINGEEVNPLSFDGMKRDPDGRFAVSHWRGIHLKGDTTMLAATLRDKAGKSVETFERAVYFADTPMHAQLVGEKSQLVADGVNRPALAVRILDRYSRPVHSGISGQFTLDGPYESASALEARQSRAVTGFGNASASWVVKGDDGIAYIELAPTMISGAFRIRFDFSDGESEREQDLEAWIVPGDMPWTLIGLAEGSTGARSIADNMERASDFDSDLGEDARVAFYAKGRVLGKYLLTAAYDSAKQKADQRLSSAIDPSAYYTIFGDSSTRLYDASSREKLYLRIESSVFYAFYGDFETGFDQTDLARYQRVATGLKSEARLGQVQAKGFAAKIGTRHRRDEIQGSGLSGPYRLSSRNIVPNSEQVTIEIRDRLRSEIIVDRRELIRFVDYEIDMASGTITFAQPVASRDPALNPQFIIVAFEVDELNGGEGEWNAGLRAAWTSADGALRIGATGITDKGDAGRSNLGAADMRLRLGQSTEVRTEFAVSGKNGARAAAFSAEIEHRTAAIDIVAYAKQVDENFGVGQQNVAERGRRKLGVDARWSLSETVSLVGSGWHEESLTDTANRDAVELRGVMRSESRDIYLGIAHLDDERADGTGGASTVFEAGATQRLLGNRLELSTNTSFALGGAEAIDLPARHRLGLRYSISQNIRAIAAYEMANGDTLDSRTLRAGVEFMPWRGSKLVTSVGKQDLGPDAGRTFAAFALGQTLQINEELTLDATIDGNRTIAGGIGPDDVSNIGHPTVAGGHLGENGNLGEDFTSYSLGVAWRRDRWSTRGRAEMRDGEFADRKGLSVAIIREFGEGEVVGGGVSWTRANGVGGVTTEVGEAVLSVASRPADSDLALLSKLEFRSDEVTGAVAGEAGPAGRTVLIVDGDAKSRRLIVSTSANWTPRYEGVLQRTEIGLFVAMRHNFDSFEGFDLAGTTLMGGLDLRIGVGEKLEIGGRASVRTNLDDGTTSFAVGPEIGFSPTDDVLVSVGYNLTGFRDRDFSAARTTNKGVFATVRLKLDSDSFGFLGLRR